MPLGFALLESPGFLSLFFGYRFVPSGHTSPHLFMNGEASGYSLRTRDT